MNLSRMIHLYNDDKEPFIDRWDGIDYEITDEPITIAAGVAEHWRGKYPDKGLRIEEIETPQSESRTPVNPLEANNRGEAFSALKKPRGRAKASGE